MIARSQAQKVEANACRRPAKLAMAAARFPPTKGLRSAVARAVREWPSTPWEQILYIHPLLSSLPDAVRKFVSDASPLRSYRKGEVVLAMNESTAYSFCVAAGLLRIVSEGSTDADLTTGFLKPDEIYVGRKLTNGNTELSDVRLVAALPSSVYLVPRSHLRKLCEQYPIVGLRLLDVTLEKNGMLHRQIRRVATLSAEQIVARALYDLTQPGPDGSRAIDKRIPQSVIASYAGLSRPVVNRVFKDFEGRGLLQRGEDSLVLSSEIGASTDFGVLGEEVPLPAASEAQYAAPDLDLMRSFQPEAAGRQVGNGPDDRPPPLPRRTRGE